MSVLLLAVTLLTLNRNGIGLTIEAETRAIDPGRSQFLTVTLRVPRDVRAKMPDLRDRLRGFSLAEDFEEEPVTEADGTLVRRTSWKLVPEPCATAYRIAPFAVRASPSLLARPSDDGALSFVAGPVAFEPPVAREPVTGAIECEPERDLPPLSWRLAGRIAGALVAFAVLAALAVLGVRFLVRKVREHRMSPIERAWLELDRLLKRGLPGRGRYKDFYVELTMVVRRYVQRRYGIRAPHLTTQEFFDELARGGACQIGRTEGLRAFLEAADMVKFAGVKATPEMADEATESARGYLKGDAETVGPKGGAK